MLIIIHLPSNYTLGLLAINHAFCFFFSPLHQLASLQEQLDSLVEK